MKTRIDGSNHFILLPLIQNETLMVCYEIKRLTGLIKLYKQYLNPRGFENNLILYTTVFFY